MAIVTEGPTRQAGTSLRNMASRLDVVLFRLAAVGAEVAVFAEGKCGQFSPAA